MPAPQGLRNVIVDQLSTMDIDRHGQRLTNCGDGIADKDYATVGQTGVNNTDIFHTMTVPKITGSGTDGSISWNKQGRVVSWIDPT